MTTDFINIIVLFFCTTMEHTIHSAFCKIAVEACINLGYSWFIAISTSLNNCVVMIKLMTFSND